MMWVTLSHTPYSFFILSPFRFPILSPFFRYSHNPSCPNSFLFLLLIPHSLTLLLFPTHLFLNIFLSLYSDLFFFFSHTFICLDSSFLFPILSLLLFFTFPFFLYSPSSFPYFPNFFSTHYLLILPTLAPSFPFSSLLFSLYFPLTFPYSSISFLFTLLSVSAPFHAPRLACIIFLKPFQNPLHPSSFPL